MQLFYAPSWTQEGFFSLSQEESHHLVSVLRKKSGEHIYLTDGKGNLIEAKIASISDKSCTLQYLSHQFQPLRPNALHLAISPTKTSDRFEWMLEKVCEIGIGQITPILCERTERSKLNFERLNKLIISACKQSKQFHFPILNPVIKIGEFITNHRAGIIAKIGAEKKLSLELKQDFDILLIGPEGDFTDGEYSQAILKGYKPITLSDSILRVETAGIVSATQWKFI